MKIEKKFRKDLNAWRWGFDATILGQRIRRYDWPLKSEARDVLIELQRRARAIRDGLIKPESTITLRHLFHHLSADKLVAQRKHLLPTFAEFIDAVDPLTPLCNLSRADWRKYLARIDGRNLKPSTINRYLAAVSSALHMACEYYSDLGEWQPPRAPWKPEPLGRDRLLSKVEISKLLAALRSERQKYERDRSIICDEHAECGQVLK